MSLPILVSLDMWQEFDDAWTESMQKEEPVDDVLVALKLAGDKKRLSRCMPHLRQHVEKLEASGRHADAARILGAALVAGGSPAELVDGLRTNAEKAWGSEDWWPGYAELTGFSEPGADTRSAWRAMERLMRFREGTLVFHPGGWGTGEITKLDQEGLEANVTFQNGRRDRFPLAAAVDIFEPLDEGDLRARYFREREDLKQNVKKEPLGALHSILMRYHGRASIVAIKNAMMQIGIEGSAWSAWWRKTRKLAEGDPWYRVLGSSAKGEVQLLPQAGDPTDDLRRGLGAVASLGDLLTRVRDHLSGGQLDERLQDVVLQVLEERAADAPAKDPDRFAAWVYLRDQRGTAPAALLEVCRTAGEDQQADDPTQAPALWRAFQSLRSLREQERLVGLLQELYGDDWLDEAARNFNHLPPGMIKPVIDALVAAGRKEELADQYRQLLARPLRAPEALVALARLVEAGRLKGDFPPPVARAQALLSLATWTYVNRKGDVNVGKVQTRLAEFLTKGKNPVLRKLLADADAETMRSVVRSIQRGVDEAIEYAVADLAARAGAHSVGKGPVYFWDDGRIWTTRVGLDKRRAEFKHLSEVLIPQNSEAIGRAASMGDLSENAEWEAAVDEQRKLTARHMEMERELSMTGIIEDVPLPENTVCPGAEVTYRELPTNEVQTIEILGPWDTGDAEHVVSYRAPLAAGLLGHKPGERTTVTLPSGQLELEVVSVRPLVDELAGAPPPSTSGRAVDSPPASAAKGHE